MEFIIGLLVDAVLISYLLPHISGFQFTGKFWPHGLLYAFGMQVMALLLGFVVMLFALGTLGLGLLVILPAMLLGFWLINAIMLKMLAHFFPTYLKLAGWKPAILAGLVLMVVGWVVSAAFGADTGTNGMYIKINTN